MCLLLVFIVVIISYAPLFNVVAMDCVYCCVVFLLLYLYLGLAQWLVYVFVFYCMCVLIVLYVVIVYCM